MDYINYIDYKEKYLKYKIKYTDLKNKQNIYNLLGGLCQLDKKFNYADLSSVLDYAKNRYECTDNKRTNKKYFVILYGPPASGKTIARKLACTYIKKYFNESLPTEDIYKSFIDTGVDELVYDAYYNEESPKKSIKDKLKHTIDTYFQENKVPEVSRLQHIKTNIDGELKEKVLKINNGIYNKYRSKNNIDDLSALLGIIGTYTNHNVFFEIASPYIDYINKLIQTIYWNNYNIVFIYPYTDNIDLLIERNYARGLLEGRLMKDDFIQMKKTTCVDAYMKMVKKSYTDSIEEYESQKGSKTMYDMYKNIMILRYNTELSTEIYSKINNYTLNLESEEFKPYIYEFDIKIDGRDA